MKRSRFILLVVATMGAVLLAASCNKSEGYNNNIEPVKPDPTAAHKGPKAVYIGDSITWQWGLVNRKLKESQKVIIPTDPTPAWMSISGSDVVITWHASFFTQNNYVDKGVSGERTDQMLSRYQTDVLAQDPFVVVIMGGTNDLAQGYTKDQITQLRGMPFGVKSLEKRQNELVQKLFPEGVGGINATRLVVRALELRILDIDNLVADEE